MNFYRDILQLFQGQTGHVGVYPDFVVTDVLKIMNGTEFALIAPMFYCAVEICAVSRSVDRIVAIVDGRTGIAYKIQPCDRSTPEVKLSRTIQGGDGICNRLVNVSTEDAVLTYKGKRLMRMAI